jgi:flagellar biosynthesis GTPase FlhF
MLSLEPLRTALGLIELVKTLEVEVEVAEQPAEIAFAKRRLRDAELVVVDTPAVDPQDAKSVKRLAALLETQRPSEVHLVVPADTTEEEVRALLAAVPATRLLVTRADEHRPLGRLATAAIETKTPFSYVARGVDATAGIAPADASDLAGLVLP